jgi:hypothetical protein
MLFLFLSQSLYAIVPERTGKEEHLTIELFLFDSKSQKLQVKIFKK